jgi:probable F420-dependent oxidoreductase
MSEAVKVGVRLLAARADPVLAAAIAEAAEELGYDSIWLPDRLIMPGDLHGRLDEVHAHLTVKDPFFDAFAYLSVLAARTTRIRLGTSVWQLGLREPFTAARAIQTLDVLSDGRAEVGIGAGWLASEFDAVGVEFSSRGRRLDEAIEICRQLWTLDVIEHVGEFFRFGPVTFEPKPVQRPWPPLHAGGESPPALRRAAGLNGWIGREHSPESVRPFVERLNGLRAGAGLSMEGFQVSVRAPFEDVDDLGAWAAAGVTRVQVRPWNDGDDPLEGLEHFARSRGIAGV